MAQNEKYNILESSRGLSLQVRISLKDGLHTRPAARLAQTAQQFKANILLKSDSGEVDAKSLLDILSLAPPPQCLAHASGKWHRRP